MVPPGAEMLEGLAPYLQCFFIKRDDIRLRVLLARKPETAPRGTIIIAPGRCLMIRLNPM